MGGGGGGSEFEIFSQERLQHSTLTEVLAAMPVGKIEMGFIDITRRTLVFWKPPPTPQGEIVRSQVLLMKEDLHLSLHNRCCLFLTLSRKRSQTLTFLLKTLAFSRREETEVGARRKNTVFSTTH